MVSQIKLQQQKLHLGPPPMVLPIRRPEDVESRREDDSFSHSPPEISGDYVATLTEVILCPTTVIHGQVLAYLISSHSV